MRNKGNRVVVITGASSGFGRGAALRFAEAGDNIVIAARRKRLLNEVAEQAREAGVEAVVVEADVSSASDVQKLAAKAVDKFGRIDVWVNNAGVGTVARFDEAPIEEHEQVIRTNLLGTVYGSYEALRQFREQGQGILINVASFAGKVAPPYLSSYAASKFGIRGLGMALREELEQNEDNNIRISTVMPVSFNTPFFEHAANHTGKPVQPIPPLYDPKKVVEAIFEMSKNPEDEVIVGTAGKVGGLAHRLSPKLVAKRMAKQAHKAQMQQEETASDSSGSLFRPMKSGDDVYASSDAGEGGSGGRFGMLAGIAVPAVMGLVYILQRRKQGGNLREWAA